MIQLLRFQSKEQGIRVDGPVYIALEVMIDANYDATNHRKKELQINVDNDAVVWPHFVDLDDRVKVEHKKHLDSQQYILTPNKKGKIRAKVNFEPTYEFSEEDLLWDSHIGSIVKKRSYTLVSPYIAIQDIARKVYDYIRRIPFTNEKIYMLTKPRTPTQVITSNRARKCVCKAELFKDMLRVFGIPARMLFGEYYDETSIPKYSSHLTRPTHMHGHAFCAFYDHGWNLADPTLGGFASEFKIPNYYDHLVTTQGTSDVKISAKEL